MTHCCPELHSFLYCNPHLILHFIWCSLAAGLAMMFSSPDEFLKLCPQGIGRYDTGADLNECEFMPNACTGGDCINTDGSYRCICPPGYVLDNSGKKCVGKNFQIPSFWSGLAPLCCYGGKFCSPAGLEPSTFGMVLSPTQTKSLGLDSLGWHLVLI